MMMMMMNTGNADNVNTMLKENEQGQSVRFFRRNAVMALKREFEVLKPPRKSHPVDVRKKELGSHSNEGTASKTTRTSPKRRCLGKSVFRFIYAKNLKVIKEIIRRNLLNIRLKREGLELNQYNGIPDQDRAIVNEAIRAKIDPNYIELLLNDYPRACETQGCVDHIDHPILIACAEHRHCVPTLLRHTPESAKQYDQNGKSPLELFLTNDDPIDITAEELASTTNLLCNLNPNAASEYFAKKETLKQHVLLHGLNTAAASDQSSHLEAHHRQEVQDEIMVVSRRLSMEL